MRSSILVCVAAFVLVGCSSGDLRAFNDALSSANGYDVYYPDQSDSDYVGDVLWTSGVLSGNGFQRFKNAGDDYCKVRVTYENGDQDFIYLDPYESSGDIYMSIYNQSDYVETQCDDSSDVFNWSFD